MYHTLLPQKERRMIRREYRIRALIVFLFVVSLAGVIGIVSLFPAYVRATVEAKASQAELAKIEKNQAATLAIVQKRVTESKKILSEITKDTANQKLSIWAQNFALNRGAVKIISLNVDIVSTSSLAVLVRGVAPTRESLLAFKQRIESEIPGSKSELPLSELAKGTNIDFSLNFTVPIQ